MVATPAKPAGSLTIISDEVSQDLGAVAQFVREFRLSGFELRSMFGRAFKDLTAADIDEIRTLTRAEGWRIHGCASPVFKCALSDRDAVRQHLEIFKRSLEIAVAIDCDLLRVFTFLRLPSKTQNIGALGQVTEHLQELAALARGTPVRIGIENEFSCIVATADELFLLMTRLPDPRVGLVWDPCNILYLPDEPLPVTRGFAELKPRIFHIHLKDAVRKQGAPGELLAASVPFGVGETGWRSHLAEIAASGYSGMLSMETHWRRQQLAEQSLHLPAGHAFSNGGAEASRTCFHNLQALIDSMASAR